MKSHHPEYLESFVKTCMAYGLDEEATTVLLDNARHKDYLENSPEYREGFHNTLVELNQDNQTTKNASGIIKAIGRGAAGLGRGIESLANMFAPVVSRGGTMISTTAKKPGFLPGLLSVPAGYGLYEGGKALYNQGKEKLLGTMDDLATNRMISTGGLPSLSGFEGGSSAGGSRGRFADTLHAMQAADAKLVGGDMRPFLSSAQRQGVSILPGLRQKYLDVENALKAPISDPSGYSIVPDLIKRREELKKQIDKATQLSSSANPILRRQSEELRNLHSKFTTTGNLSESELRRYEALSKQVPQLSTFSQQLGE